MPKGKSQGNGEVQYRNGQQVSPEALAAFYRHRTESLQNSHTTQRQQSAQMEQQKKVEDGMRPTMGIVDYVISALAGHPGFMPK
jgi:hypothetical protein